ncbi:MAG: DUF2752 domain-containing protein [Deltaproteobacteria bacterium]|nr:DUF2752 domain-containing protein [Deltaproteobacteria bacterium]
MTDPVRRGVARFAGPLCDRTLGFLILAPSATALGVAAWLDPDPRGLGTHHQLGFGGCLFHQLTGLPCPTCGMTTSFALGMEGHLWAAFVTQPFGFVLFVLTCTAAILGLADLIAPRGRVVAAWRFIETREGWIAGALLLGMLLGWAWKVYRVAFVGG